MNTRFGAFFSLFALVLCWTTGLSAPALGVPPAEASEASCPSDMVRVRDFCIDRFESSMVDVRGKRPLSPYYPPHPRLLGIVFRLWQTERQVMGDAAARALPLPELPSWQKEERFEPQAMSRPGVVPQAYLTHYLAESACKNAGKRLCSQEEWVTACKGEKNTKFPYGQDYVEGRCNVHRPYHPAFFLHSSSAVGHQDPRLNLLDERGTDPLLRVTGRTSGCVSAWNGDRIYDMVGNLDEWIDDERGVFVGGFYARSTTSGCEAEVKNHARSYYDYSVGARCCRAAR